MVKDIKVVIMGLGYIGLPTAALIASKGIKVHGVDINERTVSTINQGKIHIIEPDLEGLVNYTVSNGFLKADLNPISADVYIIAVPTPFKGLNPTPDLSYVESATKMITPYLSDGSLVILESTSPVGTTEKITHWVTELRPELKGKIYYAYCPERVLPGKVIYELERNERAIGGLDEKSTRIAVKFYSLFVKSELHATTARTAEMCKLVENSYRDTNIAFANELSMICDKANINVYELIELANKHPRVKILQPGPGVGGHCIAVDPWFIIHDYPEDSKLIHTSRLVNNYKTEWVIEKIKNAALNFELKNGNKPTVACMGITFKPDIDDIRESPSLEIVEALMDQGINVVTVEPNIENYSRLKFIDLLDLNTCDIIVYLVKHKEFLNRKINKEKVILDFCGVLNSIREKEIIF